MQTTNNTNTKERLENCFHLIFPDLSIPVEQVSTQSVAEWDSVAAITLTNVIEEEFGFQVDLDALAELDSFPRVLAYVETQAG
jgi:acyl carrier protein